MCAALNNGFPNIVPKISNTSSNEKYRLNKSSVLVRILRNRCIITPILFFICSAIFISLPYNFNGTI